MAYKFQLGNAKMAGTLQQGGGLVSTDVDDTTAANIVAEIDNNEIPGAKLVDASVTVLQMAANSVDSSELVDGSVDLSHMSANSIDSDQYVDGSIDLAHMSANSIDSDQYVDGSIDLAHMSANSIDSDQYVDGSIDEAHLADDAVSLAKMAAIARGSIISGNASGAPAALAVGTAHQFLQSDGTDLAYVSMSGDATLAAGVLSIGATKVTDAMINDDVATALAGAGIAAASGVLSLDLDELSALGSAALHQTQDHFMFSDNGTEKKITFSNLQDAVFADVSGDATVAAGGALTIAAGAVEVGMMAANSIDSDQYVDGSIDVAHMSANSIDSDQYVDGSVDNVHLANSALTIGSTSISLGATSTILAGLTSLDCTAANQSIYASAGANIITLGGGSSTIRVAGDFEVLGAVTSIQTETVEINDHNLVLDFNNSTSAVINGAGITIEGGSGDDVTFAWNSTSEAMELKLGSTPALLKADIEGSLIEAVNTVSDANNAIRVGINVGLAPATAARTWTLPSSASMAVGLSVKVKAYPNTGTYAITIARDAGAQKIDGVAADITLESDSAAITLLYVAANEWVVM
jgi:hypothetical protein